MATIGSDLVLVPVVALHDDVPPSLGLHRRPGVLGFLLVGHVVHDHVGAPSGEFDRSPVRCPGPGRG